jgi:hypothetical protein
MCDCIDRTDRELAKRGGGLRIDAAVRLNGGYPGLMAVVPTFWEGKKPRGAKPPTIVATFCPFCGTRYEPEGT